MEIDEKLIKKVAKISNLELNEEEIKNLLSELKEVLEAFSQIKQVDTKNVKPTIQPIPLKNVFREDKTEKCLSQKEALSNTKHKENGFFKGPKIL